MGAQTLQHGSLSFAQVVAKAKAETEKQSVQKKDGFMALRENVRKKLRALYLQVKPTEYFVAELICDATVNWKSQYKDIDLNKLCELAGVRMSVLRSALKTLNAMGVIKRTPHPNLRFTETMCLNPEYFGQILINTQKSKDKSHLKRHLNLVQNPPVDNTNPADMNDASGGHKPCLPESRIMTPEDMNHVNRPTIVQLKQDPANLPDPFPRLSSHIPFPDSQKQGAQGAENGERFTPSGKENRDANGDDKDVRKKVQWLNETQGAIPFDQWMVKFVIAG